LKKLDDRNIIFDLYERKSGVVYGTDARLLYNVLSIIMLRQALARPITDKMKNVL
jgi:hypothetical protein